MVVEAALGEACGLGKLGQSHRIYAALAEELFRSGNDRLPIFNGLLS
jgi:hypothetical protein